MALFGVVFGLSKFLSPDDLASCLKTDSCDKADAVVVVSGGDTNSRVSAAVQLYKNGLVGKVIVSGAAADKLGPSNAETMRHYALKSGVPSGDIIMESEAMNTEQNATFSARIIESHGWKKVVVVTSPYHQRRTGLEFKRALGENTQVLNHPAEVDGAWSKLWWMTPLGWWLALSEVCKIIVFYISLAGGAR
ncbi:MAG: YdcF family protein [Candidatus Nomurabacteria bacterium]|nr:YdcF family protein [Candidatus Nomurabacteria bacterium]